VSCRGIQKDIFENFDFSGHLPPKSEIESRSNKHLTQSRLQVTGCTAGNCYGKLSGVVTWQCMLSTVFSIDSGVRQGGTLSPALFNLFINVSISNLHNSSFGCRRQPKLELCKTCCVHQIVCWLHIVCRWYTITESVSVVPYSARATKRDLALYTITIDRVCWRCAEDNRTESNCMQ